VKSTTSWSCIKSLLETQPIGVLATVSDKVPYTNLIAFTPIANHKQLLFATLKTTSKYQNIQRNNQVSICFDNRQNNKTDFHQTTTITALGTAQEVTKKEYQAQFLEKHPYLSDFVDHQDCVIINVIVSKYIIVENFQQITTLVP